jgi:predicted 3-demethylubiquinone-9 3-methyltransferase (glyoxalase superfamily)
MQKITTCLWFDFNVEEAVAHYLSIFPNSRVLRTLYYGDERPEHAGKIMVIHFELEGQRFEAINGGPEFPFTEAVSLVVNCDTQAELDRYWNALIADGGRPVQCGWLKDRFGFNWQIVPRMLDELLAGPDRERATRVMRALLGMVKLDIAQLRAAADAKHP